MNGDIYNRESWRIRQRDIGCWGGKWLGSIVYRFGVSVSN